MIKNKKILFSLPFIIIGIIMLFLGLRWMTIDDPWMLDKVANEERLNMSFDQLFEPAINSTLPGYLKQIYRFFGLWVASIGLFIISFSRPKLIKNRNTRFSLLLCVGIIIYSALLLAYVLIPSSPFIYLGWLFLILHSTSIWIYRKF